MTSGTVEFTATQYELGDTITAYFSWTDAKWNFTAEAYATLSIYNPSGTLKEQYVEESNSEGSIPLQYTSNALGIWRARLRIWNGSSWTDLSDYCTVVSAPPPPEPPPPEPPPEPPEPEECPSFWTDPVGAVLCWIISGFEAILGWVNGSLLTNLGKMWDVVSNFSQDVLDFLGDATGSVIKWVQDNVGAIFSWISDSFLNFIDWLGDLTGSIADYIGDVVGGIVDFVTTQFTTFVDWLNELGGSIVDYIGGAIGDFVDWSSDQLGSIWTGLQDWFGEAISGLVEAFFGGLDAGVQEAKGSPLHSDEPVRNPVLKGLQKVVREHRKKYGRDPVTGEKKNGTT